MKRIVIETTTREGRIDMTGHQAADDGLVEQMAASHGMSADDYLTKYFGGRTNYLRLLEAERDATEGTGDSARRKIEDEIAKELGVSREALRAERERSAR